MTKSKGDVDKKLRVPPQEPYLGDANLDYLARMTMELLSELWIMRDRMAVLEDLLIKQGTVEKGAIDSFIPDDAFNQRAEALRSVIVTNVIGAPFKHQHTVESLISEGEKLAKLHNK